MSGALMHDPLGKPFEIGARVVYGVQGDVGAIQFHWGLVADVFLGAKPWIKVDVDPASCHYKRERRYARLYSVDRVFVVDPASSDTGDEKMSKMGRKKKARKCPVCKGSGTVTVEMRGTAVLTCRKCNGTGKA